MSLPGPDFSSGLDGASKVLVTGGSGFIGTSLVADYRAAGVTVANFDRVPPRNPADADLWTQIDLIRPDELHRAVTRFAPTHIIHLGARTDLEGHVLSDYSANVEGMTTLLNVVRGLDPPSSRMVVASS